MRRRRRDPRFVVRSVTGFAITPGSLENTGGREKTIWYVLDSAYCYRQVRFGGTYNSYGERGEKLARRFARELNKADREAKAA